MIAVAAGLGALYWWHAGGSEALLQLLQPGFQVVSIDRDAQTMLLRQANRTYTVRCENGCRDFAVGRSYPAIDSGSDLEIKIGRRRVRCPIIKIEVRFDVHPGGLGTYICRWPLEKHDAKAML